MIVMMMMMMTLQTHGGDCKFISQVGNFMCGVAHHFGVIINITKFLRNSFRPGIFRGIPQEFLEELFTEEYSVGAIHTTSGCLKIKPHVVLISSYLLRSYTKLVRPVSRCREEKHLLWM